MTISPSFPDSGGVDSALALNAPVVIKNGAGRLCRVAVNASNTSAPAVFNDNTQTGASNTIANQILAIPQNALVGSIYFVDFPCLNGIVLSAAGGGTFSASFS